MSPFLARRQYNTPTLYVGVQRIACTNIEAAPKRPWKNDLSLRGNFGLHGKTILPPSRPISQYIRHSRGDLKSLIGRKSSTRCVTAQWLLKFGTLLAHKRFARIGVILPLAGM